MPQFNVRVVVVENRYFTVEAENEAEAKRAAEEADCQGAEPYDQSVERRDADFVTPA